MSIKQLPVEEPPRPPPPPRHVDVLMCDGCGVEGMRMDPAICVNLPDEWFRGWVAPLMGPQSKRIDLCPECVKGAVLVLANERQLHIEENR